jgi:hypothetical protein
MENNENSPPKNGPQSSAQKLEAVRAVKKLSNGNSPWTIPQEILQEVIAGHTVANPDSIPPITQMTEELKKEIAARYVDDPETRDLLLESIPEVRSIRLWVKKEGWDEAVWQKVRGDRLFSADKRAQVIESLRQRAIDKSDVAAKIWLTLSGDYSEKMEIDNKTVDTYREINNILHRKSREDT